MVDCVTMAVGSMARDFALKQIVRAGLGTCSRKLAVKEHLNRRVPLPVASLLHASPAWGVGFFLMARLKRISGSPTLSEVRINGGAYYAHILSSFLAPLENA